MALADVKVDNNNLLKYNCDKCSVSEGTRSTTIKSHAKEFGFRFHFDLKEPCTPQSIGGTNDSLSIVDWGTREAFEIPVKAKSNSTTKIVDFVDAVERQFDSTEEACSVPMR